MKNNCKISISFILFTVIALTPSLATRLAVTTLSAYQTVLKIMSRGWVTVKWGTCTISSCQMRGAAQKSGGANLMTTLTSMPTDWQRYIKPWIPLKCISDFWEFEASYHFFLAAGSTELEWAALRGKKKQRYDCQQEESQWIQVDSKNQKGPVFRRWSRILLKPKSGRGHEALRSR